MQNKLSLNIITGHDKNIGSTRIRVYNLLPSLKKYFYSIEVNSKKKSNITIFQKTNDLKRLLSEKKRGTLCLFDIDDYFPTIYDDMIKYCDIVIVSTEYLKSKLLSLNSNIIVIPNSLDIDNYNISIKNKTLEDITVGWYGYSANSYILDELNIRDMLTTVSDKGDINYHINTIDETLKNFDYIVIPQKKSDHTLCKTHCRMLKALYLGVPVLVSDMPEYINLAKQLDYPSDYIIDDIYKFKEKIILLKSKKLQLPNIDFISIRKKILKFYHKDTIASSLYKSLQDLYNNPLIKQMMIRKTKLLEDYFIKSKMQNIFSIKTEVKNGKKRKIITILGIKIKI